MYTFKGNWVLFSFSADSPADLRPQILELLDHEADEVLDVAPEDLSGGGGGKQQKFIELKDPLVVPI